MNCQIDFAMNGGEKFKTGTSEKTSGNWKWKLKKKIDIWKVQIQGTMQQQGFNRHQPSRCERVRWKRVW